MHGSKKSLAAWMRVAWQFCFAEQGLSAKKLQQMMELSCYHTAWSWLQKLRLGAALAENSPCEGNVLVLEVVLAKVSTLSEHGAEIMLAMELNGRKDRCRRVRFTMLDKLPAQSRWQSISKMVAAGSTILTDVRPHGDGEYSSEKYTVLRPTRRQLDHGYRMVKEVQKWLITLYRGAVDSRYLQSYLDEFSFRHNSAFLQDRLAVLDHLLTGLVKPVRQKRFHHSSSLLRNEYEK
jgi:hypothetical protein